MAIPALSITSHAKSKAYFYRHLITSVPDLGSHATHVSAQCKSGSGSLTPPLPTSRTCLNSDLASYFWFMGESNNFSSKFWLDMGFINFILAGKAYGQN
jgi:hypothetical protein